MIYPRQDRQVKVIHKPTGISAVCSCHKSMQKNKAEALKLLKNRLMNEGHDASELIRSFDHTLDFITDHQTKQRISGARDAIENPDNVSGIEAAMRVRMTALAPKKTSIHESANTDGNAGLTAQI